MVGIKFLQQIRSNENMSKLVCVHSTCTAIKDDVERIGPQSSFSQLISANALILHCSLNKTYQINQLLLSFFICHFQILFQQGGSVRFYAVPPIVFVVNKTFRNKFKFLGSSRTFPGNHRHLPKSLKSSGPLL